MIVEKDVQIPMRDGAILRGNVYRPDTSGKYPVIMSFGPYGKDIHMSNYLPPVWKIMEERFPQILEASSCKYLTWEVVDPEVWVPHDYVVLRVDSRGAGKSPGFLDPNSPAEFQDFYDAIEWAGVQAWSSGKIGLLGVSYYAASQWMIAAQLPPYLAALSPWMGTYDFYRDRTRTDGIFSSGFTNIWFKSNILVNQYGNPDSHFIDLDTGERNTGPASLSPEELAANRADYIGNILSHPLLDDWYRERIPDLDKINLPSLVVANWGGLSLHLRGTVGGWQGIASPDKWLKISGGPYFITFYTPEAVMLQRRFFDRYLKGVENDWEEEPRVEVTVRSAEDKVKRVVHSTDWPLPNTEWTRYYLDIESKALTISPPTNKIGETYSAHGEGITFSTPPLEEEMEFAGPLMARLWVASNTEDMDLFLTVRAFAPDGKDVTFFSAVDPNSPVSQGWLRVTQRKLDKALSSEWRPVHTHDERQALVPGEAYEVQVEIWPASLNLPREYRLTLTVQGRDFERPLQPGDSPPVAFFNHDDPHDRPQEKFASQHTLYTGPKHESYLLVPILKIAK